MKSILFIGMFFLSLSVESVQNQDLFVGYCGENFDLCLKDNKQTLGKVIKLCDYKNTKAIVYELGDGYGYMYIDSQYRFVESDEVLCFFRLKNMYMIPKRDVWDIY